MVIYFDLFNKYNTFYLLVTLFGANGCMIRVKKHTKRAVIFSLTKQLVISTEDSNVFLCHDTQLHLSLKRKYVHFWRANFEWYLISRVSTKRCYEMPGEIPPHTAPRDKTYVDDKKKVMKDDHYLWLNSDDKRWQMPHREIIECRLTLKTLDLHKNKK